jgi:hypothetical protein
LKKEFLCLLIDGNMFYQSIFARKDNRNMFETNVFATKEEKMLEQ